MPNAGAVQTSYTTRRAVNGWRRVGRVAAGAAVAAVVALALAGPFSVTAPALVASGSVQPQDSGVPATLVSRVHTIVLTGAERWDAASRRGVEAALALLPPPVRGALGNPDLGPLHVLVSAEGRSLSGGQPYGGPANYFTTNEGRSEVVLAPAQSPRTVLHELGHAYNLRRVPAGSYALVYLDPEMESFLAAAGWRVVTPPEELRALRDQAEVALVQEGAAVWPRLSRNDPLEDFANSFALYFADRVALSRLSPARYVWFESRFGIPASPESQGTP